MTVPVDKQFLLKVARVHAGRHGRRLTTDPVDRQAYLGDMLAVIQSVNEVLATEQLVIGT